MKTAGLRGRPYRPALVQIVIDRQHSNQSTHMPQQAVTGMTRNQHPGHLSLRRHAAKSMAFLRRSRRTHRRSD